MNIYLFLTHQKMILLLPKDYFPWERPFMNKMVNCEWVRKNQRKLIMDLDFYQFAELIDIKPELGCQVIHSMSEPFSEEDIEDEVMHNWINHIKMHFHQLHASGHISKDQLVEMVNEINRKRSFQSTRKINKYSKPIAIAFKSLNKENLTNYNNSLKH